MGRSQARIKFNDYWGQPLMLCFDPDNRANYNKSVIFGYTKTDPDNRYYQRKKKARYKRARKGDPINR